MDSDRTELVARDAWRDSLERSRERRRAAARRRSWHFRGRSALVAGIASMVSVSGVAFASTGGTSAPDGNSAPSHRARSASSQSAVRAELRKIAQCESGGNPHAVSADGKYFGLYQFDLQTWRAYGGKGSPAAASAATQTKVARKLYAAQGKAPWPSCS